MKKKKVLLVAYYWPPSGGPGVQRWLKMTRYLVEMGCEITVLTVEPEHASYPHWDEKMAAEVHPSIEVIRTKAFNPYRIFGSGQSKSGPAANFSVPKSGRWKFRLLSAIRSHLFIPDPRRGWNRWAKHAALNLCRERSIDTVITSSPPHSSQLIGLYLKRKLGLKWIVDFRDPWTQIYYYKDLGHSAISHWLDKRYESLVVQNADCIIHVGKSMVEMLSAAYPEAKSKSSIVHNGYDERDFGQLETGAAERNGGFEIGYTGTLSSLYNFAPVFKAIDACSKEFDFVRCRITGRIPSEIESELEQACPAIEFFPEMPHAEITRVQAQADLLILIIPDVPNADYILTGKLFEYLRSGNPILCLGPKNGDAAAVINGCKAGRTFERTEVPEMVDYIHECIRHKMAGKAPKSDSVQVQQYSREALAKKVYDLI